MTISLYRKYRPSVFEDLTGQPLVNRVLINALKTRTFSHAWLFCGTRGTGKTSAAKLFAKALNCQTPIDGQGCSRCRHCLEFQAGNYPDFLELDAASNRGIDDFRNLKDILVSAPMAGKGFYRVFVIDEAHMLTTQAANAFLKTLEEPPPYVVFILATTDPEKIIPTILSRCVRLDFLPLAPRDIQQRLTQVCALENITIEPAAIDYLVKRSDGGMRDCLTSLEQAVHLCGNSIKASEFLALCGETAIEQVDELLMLVHKNRPAELLRLLQELMERGKQPSDLMKSLMQRVEQGLGFSLKVVSPSSEFPAGFLSIGVETWSRLLLLLTRIYDQMSSSVAQSMHLQTGLLAAAEELQGLQGADSRQLSQLRKKVQELEKTLEQLIKSRQVSKPETVEPQSVKPPATGSVVIRDETFDSLSAPQRDWELIRREIRQKDPITYALIEPSQVTMLEDRLLFSYGQQHQFHFRRIQEEKSLVKLRLAIEPRFGKDCILEFVLENPGQKPASNAAVVKPLVHSSETRQGESAVQEDLKRRIASDPAMKDLMQTLNADIENIV